MKADQWIEIGGYILLTAATFAGPVSAARISRRDPDSVTPVEHADVWFKRLLASPWILPPLLILNYVVELHFDLRKTTPLTRGQTFDIAFDVAGVVWGAVLLIIGLLVQALTSDFEKLREVLRLHLEITKDTWHALQDLYRLQGDIVETLKETAPKETVRKLLDIMESMTTELEKVKQKTDRPTGIVGLFRR